jgi:predicted DCC family thiol-disulfide oxidoreductase YuxK
MLIVPIQFFVSRFKHIFCITYNMEKNYQQGILLFDGICNLCNGMVQFLIKKDKKNILKFASLQSDRGQELLIKYGLPIHNFDTFVYITNDTYYLRSSAWLKIMKDIGGIWKLLYVFIIIPVPIRDFVYNMIAQSRYKFFGKMETCMLPTVELRNRFLE